jgi:hypothetical protein
LGVKSFLETASKRGRNSHLACWAVRPAENRIVILRMRSEEPPLVLLVGWC